MQRIERDRGTEEKMTAERKNARELAQQALQALDTLLHSVEGGGGWRLLVDARGALSGYVQQGAPPPDTALTVQPAATGGVTLVRGRQHFTITDEELEQVREEINARKRELRKRERRAGPRTRDT